MRKVFVFFPHFRNGKFLFQYFRSEIRVSRYHLLYCCWFCDRYPMLIASLIIFAGTANRSVGGRSNIITRGWSVESCIETSASNYRRCRELAVRHASPTNQWRCFAAIWSMAAEQRSDIKRCPKWQSNGHGSLAIKDDRSTCATRVMAEIFNANKRRMVDWSQCWAEDCQQRRSMGTKRQHGGEFSELFRRFT